MTAVEVRLHTLIAGVIGYRPEKTLPSILAALLQNISQSLRYNGPSHSSTQPGAAPLTLPYSAGCSAPHTPLLSRVQRRSHSPTQPGAVPFTLPYSAGCSALHTPLLSRVQRRSHSPTQLGAAPFTLPYSARCSVAHAQTCL